MVVLIIYKDRIRAFKPEGQAPVPVHPNGIMSFEPLPFSGCRRQPGRFMPFEKRPQPFVLERFDYDLL
jgi:hypothetical protein